MNSSESIAEGRKPGAQALNRGLDLIEAVAERPLLLADLARETSLTRSTAHRMASALVERGYLKVGSDGYTLGPLLLQLGAAAQRQTDLIAVARPHLDILARATADTVHFGVHDGATALYLDKIAGERRINISSRVGERQPLTSTGLGKALLLDLGARALAEVYRTERGPGGEDWLARMHAYAAQGCAFDLEENEDQIRCVAAPVRDASGAIVAAISVSSAAQYMDDARMDALSNTVRDAAGAISAALGHAKGKNNAA